MFFSPISYDEPLFRPPSEARSLILQATVGCSWNRCAFCEMYTAKRFRVRPEEELFGEIDTLAAHFPHARKVFLGDGNAMVLNAGRLLRILERLREKLPKLTRVSVYAGARDLEGKHESELRMLKEAGLSMIYLGIESGSDEVLAMVGKGETAESMARNLEKAKAAGIRSSVMILTGLGGERYSRIHAEESARLVSRVQPEFLSTLVLSFPYGVGHFRKRIGGSFEMLDRSGLLRELHRFIAMTDLEQVVFRSDHASNYLALKGVLGRDKQAMLKLLEQALEDPGSAPFREEWQRGL